MTETPGTTAADSSIDDEKDPSFHPQSPTEAGEKLKDEMDEEPEVAGKAKRVLQEADRQIGGEYERREDPTASDGEREDPSAQR